MIEKKLFGFSLIEMLAVIAIIGMLAALAAPTYNKYVIRSKVSSIIDIVPQFKNYITTYDSQFGKFPTPESLFDEFDLTQDSCTSNFCRDSSVGWPYVEHIEYSDYGTGKKIALRISLDEDSITTDENWLEMYCGFVEEYFQCICGGDPTHQIYEFLPDSCRDDINSKAWFDNIS